MANHRTTLKLKPYKGCEIERHTVDGDRFYHMYNHGELLGCCCSLTEAKKAIDWFLKSGLATV